MQILHKIKKKTPPILRSRRRPESVDHKDASHLFPPEVRVLLQSSTEVRIPGQRGMKIEGKVRTISKVVKEEIHVVEEEIQVVEEEIQVVEEEI